MTRCVRDIVHQRSGGSPGWFVFETVGGGKWIHAVIRFTGNSPGANRSVMSHYGKEIRDRTGKNRRNRQRGTSIRKSAAPVSFIKAGKATELTKVESSEEEEDDGGDDGWRYQSLDDVLRLSPSRLHMTAEEEQWQRSRCIRFIVDLGENLSVLQPTAAS